MSSNRFADPEQILAGFAPFDVLDAAARARLAAGARVRMLSRGEVLANPGDRVEGIWLVLEGEVKRALLSPSGTEKIIHLAQAGEFFGEESVLLERVQQATAQATRASTVLLLRTQALRAAMAENGALAMALFSCLSGRVYELLENLQQCVQRSSTQRVAHYLAQLAPVNAERCDIELGTNKQTIAAQLNLTPETLSRVLARLTRDGYILPQGRHRMRLNNLSMLRHCAAAA